MSGIDALQQQIRDAVTEELPFMARYNLDNPNDPPIKFEDAKLQASLVAQQGVEQRKKELADKATPPADKNPAPSVMSETGLPATSDAPPAARKAVTPNAAPARASPIITPKAAALNAAPTYVSSGVSDVAKATTGVNVSERIAKIENSSPSKPPTSVAASPEVQNLADVIPKNKVVNTMANFENPPPPVPNFSPVGSPPPKTLASAAPSVDLSARTLPPTPAPTATTPPVDLSSRPLPPTPKVATPPVDLSNRPLPPTPKAATPTVDLSSRALPPTAPKATTPPRRVVGTAVSKAARNVKAAPKAKKSPSLASVMHGAAVTPETARPAKAGHVVTAPAMTSPPVLNSPSSQGVAPPISAVTASKVAPSAVPKVAPVGLSARLLPPTPGLTVTPLSVPSALPKYEKNKQKFRDLYIQLKDSNVGNKNFPKDAKSFAALSTQEIANIVNDTRNEINDAVPKDNDKIDRIDKAFGAVFDKKKMTVSRGLKKVASGIVKGTATVAKEIVKAPITAVRKSGVILGYKTGDEAAKIPDKKLIELLSHSAPGSVRANQVMVAIEARDKDSLNNPIKKGRGQATDTLMTTAAKYGHTDIVNKLMERGIKPEDSISRDNKGEKKHSAQEYRMDKSLRSTRKLYNVEKAAIGVAAAGAVVGAATGVGAVIGVPVLVTIASHAGVLGLASTIHAGGAALAATIHAGGAGLASTIHAGGAGLASTIHAGGAGLASTIHTGGAGAAHAAMQGITGIVHGAGTQAAAAGVHAGLSTGQAAVAGQVVEGLAIGTFGVAAAAPVALAAGAAASRLTRKPTAESQEVEAPVPQGAAASRNSTAENQQVEASASQGA